MILDEAHEVLQGLSWQGTYLMTEKELINTVCERLRNVGDNSVKNALIKTEATLLNKDSLLNELLRILRNYTM